MTRRYPAYKDSGLEWVGEVPEGWRILPALSVGYERQESNVGMVEDNLLSLSYGRIVGKDIEGLDGLLPESFETYQIVHPGDIVLRLTDLQNDKRSLRSAIVRERGIITSAYVAFAPTDVDCNYLSYLLRAYDLSKVFYSMGGGLRQGMKFSDIRRMPVLLPPLPEQIAIAAFLDRETEKIDALVAEQRRLINLLREKRQVVISHAVIKGLNPDAPLKPSGIDWLGDVPEGWEVVRLRNVATLNPSKSEVGHLPGETEVSFLPMEAVGENGDLDLERTRLLSEVINGYTYFAEGDVTYAKITPCFENGKGALMRGLHKGFGFGTTELTVLRPNQGRILPEFLECVLSSPNFRLIGEGAMYGAGGQKRVPDDFARDFIIGLPRLEEQREITAAIDRAKLQFDTLTTTAETAIALLQERRAALISAAVTGKIDVRHLSLAATEAA